MPVALLDIRRVMGKVAGHRRRPRCKRRGRRAPRGGGSGGGGRAPGRCSTDGSRPAARCRRPPPCYTSRVALHLDERHLAAVRAHARRRYPQECCGLLLGERAVDGARVHAVLRARNLDPAPSHGYFVDPRALLRGHRAARGRGLDVVGYYHSHPDAAARPSRRDEAEALVAEVYLIVAVAGGAAGEARSFRRSRGATAMVEEPMRVLAASSAARSAVEPGSGGRG
jgi:proteasome lid subunit RPN8/RPN11